MMKIGVLGVNERGHGYYYAPAWNAPDTPRRCRVTHAWDPEPAVVQAFAQKERGIEILDDPEAVADATDGGMITTLDPDTYLDLARLWLENGKPVFLNRPFAGHPDDAREMMSLAEANGTRLWSASALAIVPALEETRARLRELGGPRFYIAAVRGRSPLFYVPHVLTMAAGIVGTGACRVFASGVRNPAFAHLLEPVPCDVEIPDVTGISAIIEYGAQSDFGPFQGVVCHQPGAKGIHYTFEAYCAEGVVEPRDCAAGGGLFENMVDTLDRFFAEGQAPTSASLALHVCELYYAIRMSLTEGQPIEVGETR